LTAARFSHDLTICARIAQHRDNCEEIRLRRSIGSTVGHAPGFGKPRLEPCEPLHRRIDRMDAFEEYRFVIFRFLSSKVRTTCTEISACFIETLIQTRQK
jgi:hypothetical protein